MAKPVAKTTTWLSLTKARDHVAQAYLSPKYAEQWIADRLAAGDLDWRARAVIPSGHPTDKFWQGAPSIDWPENSARKLIGVDVPMTIALEYASLVGVEVALEGLPPIAGQAQPVRKLSSDEWLYQYFDRHPRSGAPMKDYVENALRQMRQARDVERVASAKTVYTRFYAWRKGK